MRRIEISRQQLITSSLLCAGLLLAQTSRVGAQIAAPVFTYFGTVLLPGGAPIPQDGYVVVIATKLLGQILHAPVGVPEPGKYSVTVIDPVGSRAAVAGDSIEVVLLNLHGVRVGEPLHAQLTTLDISAMARRTDLELVRIDFLLTGPPPRPIALGQPEVIRFSLTNFSNVADTYDVLARMNHSEWITSSPDEVGPVEPNEAREIAITVTAAPGVPFQETLTLRACSRLRPSSCQQTATGLRPQPVDVAAPPISRVALYQNSPNPFNPSTSIAFELAPGARTSLQILDARGRVLRVLLRATELNPGRHTLLWNGLDDSGHPAPSGVYEYRLTTPHGSRARRMVLVR